MFCIHVIFHARSQCPAAATIRILGWQPFGTLAIPDAYKAQVENRACFEIRYPIEFGSIVTNSKGILIPFMVNESM